MACVGPARPLHYPRTMKAVFGSRALWFLAGALVLAFPAASAETEKPNIVIIFTDDQGYADVGVFGAKGFKTPHLDRLAKQGRMFSNFHAAQAVCSASRAGLLTGCYPNRIGIHGALGPNSRTGISAGETTLAELLRERGYATAVFGKWHLGDAPKFLPTRHGFDQYFGLPYSNDMWPFHPALVVLPEGDPRRGRYPDLPLFENEQIVDPRVTAHDQEQLTTSYTQRAVKFIEANRDKPFFLYLAHNMPHVPLFVSDRFRGKTRRGLYGDVIAEIDWSVGQVIAALERTGVRRSTLVIFASDNGPWLSYGAHSGAAVPLREGKGTSWEGGTRVPCIMSWPGKIPAGGKSDRMLMTIDLLPTIAGLTGATLPAHRIDGANVWPIISGQPGATNPHSSYWFYYEMNQLQAVTTGDGEWKLVLPHQYRTLNGRAGRDDGMPIDYGTAQVTAPELYRLAADVSERRNVAAEHPEILDRLLGEAEKARAELGDSLTKRTGTGAREPGRL